MAELIELPASTTTLAVKIHPLVLVTITDYITRHTLRNNDGPMLGAVLGQYDGSTVSMRHAFEAKTDLGRNDILLDEPWFATRLELYRDVHSAPALDLVAIFQTAPASVSPSSHAAIIQQAQHMLGRDVLLLLFHSDVASSGDLSNGQLPISVFRWSHTQFETIPYEIETDESELIAMGYVARGGGNAEEVPVAPLPRPSAQNPMGAAAELATANAGNEVADSASMIPPSAAVTTLSAHDQELISSMTKDSNAVKMLRERIDSIRTYLSSLPPSYLSDASIPMTSESSSMLSEKDSMLLRSISSLLSRLPLLDSHLCGGAQVQSSPNILTAADRCHVGLVSLLSALTKSTFAASELSRKHKVVSKARHEQRAAAAAREVLSGGTLPAAGRGHDGPLTRD